jgi:hypothetical protein
LPLDAGLVRVPTDDSCSSGGSRVNSKVVNVVEQVYVAPGQFDPFCGWQTGTGTVAVDIALDSSYRGQQAKLVEYGEVTDISGMKNMVAAAHYMSGFGAEQAVSIRYDSHTHR